MNIAFFGLGGVGGYFAAQMVDYYKNNNELKFYFIARGAHMEAIRSNGLRLDMEGHPSIISHPTLVTDNTKECPKMDFIVYSTKSYSIEESIPQLRSMCDNNTVIFPFMNGIDAYYKLKDALPEVTIVNGCVYVFSHISQPGVIVEKGKYGHFYIGGDKYDKRISDFYDLAMPAVSTLSYEDNIEDRVWKKMCRISVFATLTTHYNITNGEIKNSTTYLKEYNTLFDEFFAVTMAMGIFKEGSKEILRKEVIDMVESSPDSATSSMQRDYWSGKMSELESLTKYIICMGDKYGIETPTYDKAYNDLIKNK